MSNNHTHLYRELQSSIQSDKMYWIRNDAKIRAVVNSKNYDEFKDYVAAAHLSSLSRKQMLEKKDINWNKALN